MYDKLNFSMIMIYMWPRHNQSVHGILIINLFAMKDCGGFTFSSNLTLPSALGELFDGRQAYNYNEEERFHGSDVAGEWEESAAKRTNEQPHFCVLRSPMYTCCFYGSFGWSDNSKLSNY